MFYLLQQVAPDEYLERLYWWEGYRSRLLAESVRLLAVSWGQTPLSFVLCLAVSSTWIAVDIGSAQL